MRDRYPGAQIYYYGESLGAALVIRFLAQAREPDLPDGLVLASPVVVVPGDPSWWQRQVFRFLLWARPGHRIDVSKFTKRDKDNPSKWVTRDEAHRRWFETAPHKIESYTVRFFQSIFDLISGCLDAAPKNKGARFGHLCRARCLHPARAGRGIFARVGSREKELRFFPESYHLLLHDYDKAQVLERIEAWLLRRIDVTDRSRTAGGALRDRGREANNRFYNSAWQVYKGDLFFRCKTL